MTIMLINDNYVDNQHIRTYMLYGIYFENTQYFQNNFLKDNRVKAEYITF